MDFHPNLLKNQHPEPKDKNASPLQGSLKLV